ncbi:MAG: zinc ABC transporter substrate-binding protein [Planktomarina sp.]
MLRSLTISLSFLSTLAYADAPKVATDIPPVHGLVSAVMQGVGTPAVLLRPGMSAHGFALRPSDARALSQADAFFWIGPDLWPGFEGDLDTVAPNAKHIALLQHVHEGDLIKFAEEVHHDDHDDHGHDDAHHEEEGHDDHNHGEFDPHAWLSPHIAQDWVKEIVATLSEIDPENAATYAANGDALMASIEETEDRINAQFEAANIPPFIMFHGALGYFTKEFGVGPTVTLSVPDASAPKASHLIEVREIMANNNIGCAVTELEFDPRYLEAVAPGQALKESKLDLLGHTVPKGPDMYVTFLQGVADSILACQ